VIFDQYLALASMNGGVSSTILTTSASVHRSSHHDETPRISESCLWQQASTG